MVLPRHLLLSLFLFLVQTGCAHRAPAQSPPSSGSKSVRTLQSDLEKIFSDPRLVKAQICVEIMSLAQSEVLYAKNPEQLFVPASTNKLVTSAVALLRLGPEYRFETHVYADGSVENGILKGNLLIAGSGDPSFSPRFYGDDPFAVFKNWAALLKEKGISAISGTILGNNATFDAAGLGLGWEWNDLPFSYATRTGALSFNDNMATMRIEPGAEKNNPGIILTSPIPDYPPVNNRVVTGPENSRPEIRFEYGESNTAMDVLGTIPAKGTAVVQNIAVRSPAQYFLSALAYTLSRAGIGTDKWEFRKTGMSDLPGTTLLWTHKSPPLPEILKPLLKKSQNFYAETLARTLGLKLRGQGAFDKGMEVVEETLTQIGIPAGTYVYADGSGLSRQNLQSAESLTRLLRYMRQDKNFQIFYDSLPTAGIDGTLSDRMNGSKTKDNVHAKTGSMANVSSICGYVKTADGEMLAFSIAINNSMASKKLVESIQDKAIERLAEFSREK